VALKEREHFDRLQLFSRVSFKACINSTAEKVWAGVAMKLRFTGWLGALALVMTSVAPAHHSFAMFDQNKQLPLKGTVLEFQWTNPHAFIQLETPQSDGAKQVWSIELNSPNNLKRQGWKSSSLKAGDNVTVIINPLRDGQKGGLFVSVTLPDGKVLGDATRARGGPVNVPTVP
jgi:hypothetical protein